jgi:hypothetical protein
VPGGAGQVLSSATADFRYVMKRRSRSGTADSRSEIAKLSRAELDAEIHRCVTGVEIAGTSVGAKSFFKRLVLLESERESLYDVPAPRRKFNSR